MLKSIFGKFIISAAAILSLVASVAPTGGVGDVFDFGGLGASDTPDFRILNEANSGGEAFTSSVNVLIYTKTDGYKLIDNKDYTLAKNSSGGFDLELNGQSISFNSDNWIKGLGGYGKLLSDTTVVSLNAGQGIVGYQSEFTYVDVIDALSSKGSDDVVIGFGVFGFETQTPPTNKTVTFTGKVRSFVNERDNFSFSNKITGDLSLSANFDTSKISGNITEIRNGRFKQYPGQLDLKNGVIAGSGYAADLVADGTFNAALQDTITGKLNGGFYGPNAEETAGRFVIDTERYIGIGTYEAK